MNKGKVMKNRLWAGLAVLTLAATTIFAHGNEPGRTALAVTGGEVVIDYVAPTLKGRDLMALIKQPGANPWRLGADAATTLTTPVELKFGDGVLSPGKYVLRAYLDESGSWWLQAYDSNREVVGKLALKSSDEAESKERLEIVLSGSADAASVHIQWGAFALHGEFSVAD